MNNQTESYRELAGKYTSYNEKKVVDQLKIYEETGFSINISKLLLQMIFKAVEHFRDEKNSNNSNKDSESWFYAKKNEVFNFQGRTFQTMALFAVDEKWWGLKDILFELKVEDFLAGDPDKGVRDRVPFGFILEPTNTDSKEIYIIIRGTQTAPEWFNNLNFNPKETYFLEEEFGEEFGTVHRGFNNIYTKRNPGNPQREDDDEPSIKKAIDDYIRDKEPDRDSTVYIAGHSLGAALATLASVHVHSKNYFSQPPILYTFASPRVGTENFASLFNPTLKSPQNLEKITAYRVINSEDIIATFPIASPRIFPSESNDVEINEALNQLADNELSQYKDKSFRA